MFGSPFRMPGMDHWSGPSPAPALPNYPGIQQVANAPDKPKGMFGGASIDLGRAIAGYLAGIGNPAGVQALQAMNEQRLQQQRAAQEDAQYQRHHDQQLTDEKSLFDYKAAHAGPDDFTQRVQALEALQPGLGTKYAQNYAANGGGLGQIFKDPATGQSYAIGGASAPSSGPQPGVIEQGFRFKGGNPADPNAWEPVNGGQAATPPATFP